MERKYSFLFVLLFFFMLSVVSFSTVSCGSRLSQEQKDSLKAFQDSLYNAVMARQDSLKSYWKYEESVDEMTDRVTYIAYLESDNYVELKSPYNSQKLAIGVLKSSKGERAVVTVKKGQFNVAVEKIEILARFDKGEPISFVCEQLSTHENNTLVIKDYELFVSNLLNSRECIIQVAFYGNGNKIFKFKNQNFEWNH